MFGLNGDNATDNNQPNVPTVPDGNGAAQPPVIEPTAPPPADPGPPPVPTPPVAAPGDDDLMQIKQQALQNLAPLVGHLDQTPEERFKTTMMMLQASDNQDLVKDAYAAAQAIPDEKTRAQALLDVVNEINYFTHQAGQKPAN